MRWFWIDRFVEFRTGHCAVAEKAVTLAEEQLDNYIPGFPVMPPSLIIEGLAQTGGLLVNATHAFRQRTVLAKVGRCEFYLEARPGDVLRYEVTIQDLASDGAIVRGQSTIAGELQAEAELFFAHLDARFAVEMFYPADFLAILRLFGVFDVGQNADGTPLEVPDYLLEAEIRENRDGKWAGASRA